MSTGFVSWFLANQDVFAILKMLKLASNFQRSGSISCKMELYIYQKKAALLDLCWICSSLKSFQSSSGADLCVNLLLLSLT